jgi:hypothetical protein
VTGRRASAASARMTSAMPTSSTATSNATPVPAILLRNVSVALMRFLPSFTLR